MAVAFICRLFTLDKPLLNNTSDSLTGVTRQEPGLCADVPGDVFDSRRRINRRINRIDNRRVVRNGRINNRRFVTADTQGKDQQNSKTDESREEKTFAFHCYACDTRPTDISAHSRVSVALVLCQTYSST